MDSVIPNIRRTYIGKRVDEDFLYDLKVLLENKGATFDLEKEILSKSPSVPTQEIQNMDFECLSDEIIVKIFRYLDS